MGNALLLIAAFLPIVCAPLCWAVGRKNGRRAIAAMVAVTGAELALLLGIALACFNCTFTLDGFVGMGLRMKADGFRALYACVACVMWLVTSIFSRDYLKDDHAPGRYALFTLLTQGATVGLFLSDSLFSAFVFFEVMSMASYPWVAHEEEPAAMRAAETYLYIAVIGGLVMLMGIFLLPDGMAGASYADLPSMLPAAGSLWLPTVLILFGFGAKAGAFPLHIWLPKAHPVAPAPASALLSGMLTKAGVLGMLVLTLYVMRGNTAFGGLIFRLGVITMFLGALLAIFSTNLKRTLACSSLSQIGFIMIGVGTQGLCACENGLAAFGTIQHMVNHSLFKLALFLCAGAVAMNAHALSLDDVRGFGRSKPALHIAFLLPALGISGVPLFSGYISKSLLHEGMLEMIAELRHKGLNALPYQIAEWVFIISGGMTLCYMTKLYICLFWQKHPTRQAEFDAMTHYMSVPSAIALVGVACIVPVLGLFPQVFMTGLGRLAQPFFAAADPAHMPIAYFSAENLIGAAKSIVIGVALFFLQRRFVMGRDRKGNRCYPERWPKWLDLEDGIYRPLLRLLVAVGYAVAWVLDKLMDWLIVALRAIGGFVAGVLNLVGDTLALIARRVFLRPLHSKLAVPVGNRFTYNLGRALDEGLAVLHGHPMASHYESLLAAGQKEVTTQFKRFTRSISFGLMMMCAGLVITVAYLLWF